MTREELTVLIDAAVERAVTPLTERATDRMRELTARFEPQLGRSEPKGTGFARIVRALAASRGIPQLAADFAAKTWGRDGDAIAKALAAGSGSSGGFLVPEQFSLEVIELLRGRAVVRQAGATVVPMSGSLLMPKHTAGASAAYVGENQAIAKATPSFGQIRMTSRKLAALVPISNDLLRPAAVQADQVVLDDLVASLAVTEDGAFIRDDGTANAPKGMRYWANAANVTASAGATAADIEADLKDLVNDLEGNDVGMVRPAWIMAPRSRNHLYVLRDANGNLTFPELRVMDPAAPFGRLWGYPVFPTSNVPTNLGGGTETEVYFADMADVVIAEDGQIEISISDTAAYHDGANVIAAFSNDQTVVRAIARHDLAVRHDRSVAIKTGVTWGA
jgi:HK97 family phage major capsid protein